MSPVSKMTLAGVESCSEDVASQQNDLSGCGILTSRCQDVASQQNAPSGCRILTSCCQNVASRQNGLSGCRIFGRAVWHERRRFGHICTGNCHKCRGEWLRSTVLWVMSPTRQSTDLSRKTLPCVNMAKSPVEWPQCIPEPILTEKHKPKIAESGFDPPTFEL